MLVDEEEITFPPTYRFERDTREKYVYTKAKATGVSLWLLFSTASIRSHQQCKCARKRARLKHLHLPESCFLFLKAYIFLVKCERKHLSKFFLDKRPPRP